MSTTTSTTILTITISPTTTSTTTSTSMTTLTTTTTNTEQCLFTCMPNVGCRWSFYTENMHWRLHSSGAISEASCKEQCLSSADCTGIEWPFTGHYCAFWLLKSCTIATGPNNPGWMEGFPYLLCTRQCPTSTTTTTPEAVTSTTVST